jgi:hypothetical protein
MHGCLLHVLEESTSSTTRREGELLSGEAELVLS